MRNRVGERLPVTQDPSPKTTRSAPLRGRWWRSPRRFRGGSVRARPPTRRSRSILRRARELGLPHRDLVRDLAVGRTEQDRRIRFGKCWRRFRSTLNHCDDCRHYRGGQHERQCADRPRPPREDRPKLQRGILPEDRLLQLAKLAARFHAEVLDELLPRIGTERLGVASGAVEGEHELAAESFPRPVLRGQCLEFRNERVVATECELGLASLLRRNEPQFLQPLDLRAGEVLVGQICKRRTAPECNRGIKSRERPGVLACGVLPPTLLEQSLEPMRVDLLRLDLEDVACSASSASPPARTPSQP